MTIITTIETELKKIETEVEDFFKKETAPEVAAVEAEVTEVKADEAEVVAKVESVETAVEAPVAPAVEATPVSA